MKGNEMEQQTYSSKEAIRRQLYELDKLRSAFEPFGPDLYWHLKQMVEIAGKYERRDGIDDARDLLKRVKQAVDDRMEWQ